MSDIKLPNAPDSNSYLNSVNGNNNTINLIAVIANNILETAQPITKELVSGFVNINEMLAEMNKQKILKGVKEYVPARYDYEEIKTRFAEAYKKDGSMTIEVDSENVPKDLKEKLRNEGFDIQKKTRGCSCLGNGSLINNLVITANLSLI